MTTYLDDDITPEEPLTDKPECAGNYIAHGKFRVVYEHKTLSDYVVKVQHSYPAVIVGQEIDIDFNKLEYLNYVMLCKYGLGSYLAPCKYENSYLLMRKADPAKELPKQLPFLFSDNKLDNWGIIDGNTVKVDYQSFTSHLNKSGQLSKIYEFHALKDPFGDEKKIVVHVCPEAYEMWSKTNIVNIVPSKFVFNVINSEEDMRCLK